MSFGALEASYMVSTLRTFSFHYCSSPLCHSLLQLAEHEAEDFPEVRTKLRELRSGHSSE